MDNGTVSSLQNEEIKTASKTIPKRIMVAGIGNIFLQDDGFGTEVIKKIQEKNTFTNVEINDVGIGGLKLAYDLMKGYDGLIIIDASRRGEAPGTIYIIEPDEKDINGELNENEFIDPHGTDPATVLKFIKALGAWPTKVIVIGCEPGQITAFQIGLSEPVSAAVDQAVELAEEIIEKMSSEW